MRCTFRLSHLIDYVIIDFVNLRVFRGDIISVTSSLQVIRICIELMRNKERETSYIRIGFNQLKLMDDILI